MEHGGNGLAIEFRKFLYKDATLFLKRKRDKFCNENVVINDKLGFTRKALEASIKAKQISIIATNILTGEEIIYNSLKDAAPRFHSDLISDCLHGRQKTHRGHTFKRFSTNN